ncbi:MAG: hypothetical protein ACREV4_06050 [Gammaproteobacteria bacterium]
MKSTTLSALKRPRCFIPLSLFLILIVALGILFHPSIQKKFLLAQLTPLTEGLHIAHVHLTPWSLTLEDAHVRYRGGDFRLKSALVRFCLGALLRKTISLDQVSVDQLSVDLTHFKPDETPKSDTPFSGVLASLNTGLRIAIPELSVNGRMTRKPGETIRAKINGGLQTEAVGGLNLALSLHRQGQQLGVDGVLYLKQSARGGFEAIATDLRARVKAKALPLPLEEKARIAVSVKEGILSNTARSGEQAISPEVIRLGIYLDPEKPRSVLGFSGVYDGNVGLLRGAYRISANQALVRPYLKGQPVPNMIDKLTGQMRLDITKLIGDVTLNNDLTLTNLRKFSGEPSMPQTLSVLSELSLTLEADALRLSRFDTQLMDDGGKRYLSTTLPSAVRLGLEDPMRFLETNKPLFLLRLEGIPASWAAPLIPGYTISDGRLQGVFKLVAAKANTLRVVPMKALTLKGARVSQGEQPIAEQLGLTMRPQFSYKKSALEIAIEDFVVEEGTSRLASTTLKARIPNAGKGDPEVHVDAKAEVDLNQLATLPTLREGSEKLPSELSFAFQGKVAKSTRTIQIQELTGGLSQGAGKRFFTIDLARPISVPLKQEKGKLKNPQGTLATVSIDKLDLAWLSPFVPDAELSGKITRAEFELNSDGKDQFVLTPRIPLEITGLSVTSEREALFESLAVKLSPTLTYSPERLQIDYRKLGISANNKPLIAASGTLSLPSSQPASVKTSGDTEIDLQALAGQPLVQRLLGAPITGSARINADYRLVQANRALDIERLAVKLSQEDSPIPAIEVQSNGKIRVPTALRPGEPLARGTRGGINLVVRNWKPTPFEQVLRERNISFTQASGNATLASDGRALSLDTKEPFVIQDLQVRNEKGDLLHPLTLGFKGTLSISDRDLRAKVDDVTIDFLEQNPGKALRANVAFELNREEERFKQLSAKLFAWLPEWLDQPAMYPGHSLVDGALESAFEIDPFGKIKWNTGIRDLKGREKLPLQAITLTGNGVLMRDGGFSLRAPLTTEGKSGKSDAVITANYSTQSEPGLLQLGISGRQFYLNDILATFDKIRTKPAAAKEQKKPKEAPPEAEEAVLSQTPDARAFWDRLPYPSQLELKLNQLFYTDYLVLHGIRGGFDLTASRLGVRNFSAYFHESPITVDGGVDFKALDIKPYDLKLDGAIKEFDLNKFFTELIPKSKPRVEGLFGVTFDLAAQSPNLDQFRNHLDLDIKLSSRDGVFRPLPPDNVFLTGATPVLGVIGEGLSFVPTIGLGAGVVPRLVSYIKEIDYDTIDIHITGGGPKGLTIEQFLVNSPNILITAEGGIEYRAGVDVLNRPLSLSAEMNMRGRGAAILHTLDLLKPEQDRFGYWKGPEFRIWGTPRKPKSNFNEIIQKAGKETLTGGIRRPFSGIIGNFRYRW